MSAATVEHLDLVFLAGDSLVPKMLVPFKAATSLADCFGFGASSTGSSGVVPCPSPAVSSASAIFLAWAPLSGRRKSAISLERGVHLELPELDLIDKNLLSKPNVLFSPSQFIQNKFYNDSFIPLKISRVGINQWSIDGFFKSPAPMRENEIADFLAENLQRFLDKLLEVEPLAIGASGDRLILSVKGLGSFDDFKKTEEELGRIFAIKSKTYRFFDKTSIDFDLHLFYSASSLLKELRGSSSFIIKNYDAPNSTLYLELIN